MKPLRSAAIILIPAMLAGCANTSLSKQDQIVILTTIAGAAAGIPIGNAVSSVANAGLYGAMIGAASGFVVGKALVTYLDDQEKEIRLSNNVSSGNLLVERDRPQALKLTLARDATFHSSSAKLTEHGKQTLDEIAGMLKSYNKTTLAVIGHTDSSGDAARNQSLSERRALAVADYMINKGITAERITTKGMGEQTPAYANDTIGNRAKNRRVEIIISGPEKA